MNGDHVSNSLVHHVISLDVPLWIKAMDWLKIKGKRVSDSYRPGCSGVGMDWLQPMGCRWDSSSPPKISSYSLPKHQEAVCNGPSPWASASIYFRNRAVISKPQSHVLRISAVYALFTPYPTNLAVGPMRPILSEVVNFLKRRKKKETSFNNIRLCVTRIFVGPRPATPWGWPMLGPCVTRRGAAPS